MDKLMNAAGSISNERRECKFNLPYKGTWKLTTELLSGMLEPLGFGGQEDELMPVHDDYIMAGEVYKPLINFVMKHADVLHDRFSVIDFIEYYNAYGCEHTIRTIIDLDNKHTKLSEVGDYTDTFKDNWYHEDHDIFTINNGYALVTKNKTKQYKEDWSDVDRTIEVVIIKIDNNPYEGLTVIPKESTLLCDVTYKDVTIKRDIAFSDKYMYELKISGNVVINSETPLLCSGGVVRIKGTPGSKLTLISGEQQPCIGPKTHTGMSYGRWSPSGSTPKEVIIDGAEVICQSMVESFSIGCYGGSNEIPKITLLNGADLICPETTGERVIIKAARAPGGSTKISEDMVYAIKKTGQHTLELVSADVKDAYNDLICKHPRYSGTIALTTTVKDIGTAMEILHENPRVNVELIIMSDAPLYIKRAAVLLRLPDRYEAVKHNELKFETLYKSDFIKKLIYKGADIDDVIAAVNLIHLYKCIAEKGGWWDFIKEVCYEMIPSYYYDFQEHRGSSHEEHVNYFLESNHSLITKEIQDMIDPQSINYFLWDD